MREDYVPNEKYRNMFGIERNGYGMERVDLYLAQLEVAFKKIREDNRNLKREFSAHAAAPGMQPTSMAPAMMPPDSAMQQLAAQEQYITQLQVQLAEQQEQAQRLAAQLREAGTQAPRPDDQLLEQMTALRAEADELRRQLRRQTAPQQMPGAQIPGAPIYPEAPLMTPPVPDNRQDIIGKVLVDAQAQAEEIRRTSQMEAEQAILIAKQSADQTILAARQTADQTMAAAKHSAEQATQAANQQAAQTVAGAKQQLDALRAEKERIHTQLQEISYALRGVLRLGENDTAQQGDKFADD